MGAYLRLVVFVKTIAKEVSGKVFLGLLIMATYVAQAFALAAGIDAVFKQRSKEIIIILLLFVVLAIVIRGFLIRWQEIYSKQIGAKVKGDIRTILLEKLLCLGPGYQSGKRSGNIQSLLTDGVEAIEPFLVNYLPQVVVFLLTDLCLIVYLLRLDLWVGAILAIIALLAVGVPHLTMPLVKDSTIGYWQSYAVLNAQYIDMMQGMTTLKAFAASERKGRELGENAEELYRQSVRNTTYSLFDSAFITLLMTMGTAVPLLIGVYHLSVGTLSSAHLLIILFLLPECMRPITELNHHWHSSYLGFSVAEGFFAVLDQPVLILEEPQAEAVRLKKTQPSLALEQVTFAYQSGGSEVLKAISLEIKSGQTVAIVGRSGSGKSTLTQLILRFYEVTAGRILLDDQDIRSYGLTYLRDQIAIVFQDTYLFYGTVEENIRLANPKASLTEVMEAAKNANAHDFIMQLPAGYQTLVGERGSTLSGGERQRISIARAILKNAPFLILDEATSSVDAASEKAIQDALEKLMQNRTTLIIAHRLSTIKKADQIFVLEAGVLKEQGIHETLLEKNGCYAKLICAQQGGNENE